MPVPAKSEDCPVCGFEFPMEPKSNAWIAWLLLIGFLLLTLGGVLRYF